MAKNANVTLSKANKAMQAAHVLTEAKVDVDYAGLSKSAKRRLRKKRQKEQKRQMLKNIYQPKRKRKDRETAYNNKGGKFCYR